MQKREFKDLDDLIIKLLEYQQRKQNKNKKLKQICIEMGLYDTMTLCDERTFQLFQLWNFYRYSPTSIMQEPFFDAVQTFNLTLGVKIG